MWIVVAACWTAPAPAPLPPAPKPVEASLIGIGGKPGDASISIGALVHDADSVYIALYKSGGSVHGFDLPDGVGNVLVRITGGKWQWTREIGESWSTEMVRRKKGGVLLTRPAGGGTSSTIIAVGPDGAVAERQVRSYTITRMVEDDAGGVVVSTYGGSNGPSRMVHLDAAGKELATFAFSDDAWWHGLARRADGSLVLGTQKANQWQPDQTHISHVVLFDRALQRVRDVELAGTTINDVVQIGSATFVLGGSSKCALVTPANLRSSKVGESRPGRAPANCAAVVRLDNLVPTWVAFGPDDSADSEMRMAAAPDGGVVIVHRHGLGRNGTFSGDDATSKLHVERINPDGVWRTAATLVSGGFVNAPGAPSVGVDGAIRIGGGFSFFLEGARTRLDASYHDRGRQSARATTSPVFAMPPPRDRTPRYSDVVGAAFILTLPR